MDHRPLVLMGAVGLVGYAVFHGHRLNQDCWLCKYRGLAFMGGSVGLGLLLAFSEN